MKSKVFVKNDDASVTTYEFESQTEAYQFWLNLPAGVRAAFRAANGKRNVYAWDYVDRLKGE